jgi:hypothetical protein
MVVFPFNLSLSFIFGLLKYKKLYKILLCCGDGIFDVPIKFALSFAENWGFIMDFIGLIGGMAL